MLSGDEDGVGDGKYVWANVNHGGGTTGRK